MSEVTKVIREEDVSFVHNKDEAWTVGYVAEQRKDRIAVRAAASFCNYKDKFNRKIGRQIVTGRLNCDRDNGRLHHVEFFLSGKMPTTGDMWRQFERAVVSQTMEAYQEGVGLEEQMGATRKDGECIAPVAGPDYWCKLEPPKDHNNDRNAALRLCALRVAAEIGKNMK